MEIGPTPPPQRHPAWPANQKLRAAEEALAALQQAWAGHCQAGHIRIEESRDRTERAISFIVRVTETELVAQMERMLRTCVSDARSALSNLTYELARANGADAPTLRASDFPIVSTGTWQGARDRRLKGLPADTIDRIGQVQPIAQPMPPNQQHPLELVRDLNNQDKHRDGLWVAPSLHPNGTQQFTQMQFDVTPELAAALQEHPPDPDQIIDVNPHALTDGATVLRVRFPAGVDVSRVTLSSTSLPMTLTLTSPGANASSPPLLLELSSAVPFIRQVVLWVTGVRASPPQPVRRWPLTL